MVQWAINEVPILEGLEGDVGELCNTQGVISRAIMTFGAQACNGVRVYA